MAEIVVTVLLALWLASSAGGFVGAAVFAHQLRKFRRLGFALPVPPPRVAVIVPMKGAGADAARCLAAALDQDYPAYRLVVAVEATDDPAHRLARETPRRADVPVTAVSAGIADRRGQKVHNLLAALGALEPRDEIVCFADSDALWSRGTLSTLVRELSAWDEPVLLSGQRWIFPSARAAGAVLAAAAGLAVSASAKSPRWDIAWGGTLAAKRATLERLDPRRLWARSLSDDVPLSRAARGAGFGVKLMPNLAVPSPCSFALGEAFAFARRQYAMLRLHAPRHWWFGLAVYAVFFAGLGAAAAALVLPAPLHAQGMALGALALGPARGLVHAAIAARCLPKPCFWRLRLALALDALLPVLPALLHGHGLISTLRVRAVRWAGIRYALDGADVERVTR